MSWNFLVGTSREFQGDERDIMLLTTTASHKFTEGGKIKPPRAVLGEEMMRIYNVAASRARDKAILLHSIHPEAVAKMNPECYRKRIIEYFEIAGSEMHRRKITSKADAPQNRRYWPRIVPMGQSAGFCTISESSF